MRFAAVFVLVAAACGPAATSGVGQAGPASSPTHVMAPSPTPINVDDMMGTVPAATVFAQSGNELHAVRLLNHFVLYRIALAEKAQVGVGADGARVYVADRKDGRTRIRGFDVATGGELGWSNLEEAATNGGALSSDRPDRVLLLLDAGTGVRVEGIDARSLAATGGLTKAQCGDRLLASQSRVAIVCTTGGMIQVDTLVGQGFSYHMLGPIGASAMLPDGAVVASSADGKLYLLRSGAVTPVELSVAEVGEVVPGGIAAADQGRFVVVRRSAGGATVTLHHGADGSREAGPFAMPLVGGPVLALWPFAYFQGDRGLWHVDLRTGLLERMVALARPIPLAVAAR